MLVRVVQNRCLLVIFQPLWVQVSLLMRILFRLLWNRISKPVNEIVLLF